MQQELFQTSRLISFVTKILSLTHRKCQSKPNIWILPPLVQKNKYGLSKLCRDQIFSHSIYLYNKKFDWLFIVDLIWLVWHTYISHSLTHSSIDTSITYQMRQLRGIFFLQKNNSTNRNFIFIAADSAALTETTN